MRISDWSSDVCASDLAAALGHAEGPDAREDACQCIQGVVVAAGLVQEYLALDDVGRRRGPGAGSPATDLQFGAFAVDLPESRRGKPPPVQSPHPDRVDFQLGRAPV